MSTTWPEERIIVVVTNEISSTYLHTICEYEQWRNLSSSHNWTCIFNLNLIDMTVNCHIYITVFIFWKRFALFTATRNQVAAEADEVLRPLMDLLDGKLKFWQFTSHSAEWYLNAPQTAIPISYIDPSFMLTSKLKKTGS